MRVWGVVLGGVVLGGVVLGVALAGPAGAHPHMWMDTAIEVQLDATGRAAAVRISWTYDEFSSMALIEERGLDADHDGHSTPEEEAALNGFDMGWDAGFPGDTYVLSGGVAWGLSGPSEWTARHQGGRITTSHLRRIEPPVALDKVLQVQVYDPGFYTAYTIVKRPVVLPALPEGCEAEVLAPDPAEADQRLLDALAEYGADQDVEADFPAIGAQFSEEVRLTCGAR